MVNISVCGRRFILSSRAASASHSPSSIVGLIYYMATGTPPPRFVVLVG